MKKFNLEKTAQIRQNQKELEKKLKVKIILQGRLVTIDGEADDEYFAEKVLMALSMGFKTEEALLLLRDDFMYEEIKIKTVTQRENIEQVRGLVIGREGRVLQTLMALTESYIILHDNTVAIIAPVEHFGNLEHAIESLIRGTKHANVYKFLEECRRRMKEDSLGIIEPKENYGKNEKLKKFKKRSEKKEKHVKNSPIESEV